MLPLPAAVRPSGRGQGLGVNGHSEVLPRLTGEHRIAQDRTRAQQHPTGSGPQAAGERVYVGITGGRCGQGLSGGRGGF